MEKITLCSVEKKADKAAKGGIVTFALTTKDVDRDGDIIEPRGAQLNHFLTNPVFLWAHDHRRPPIGKVLPETITISDSKIIADVKFDLNDPFAKLVYEKYKSGFLNAGSIRFRPLEYEPIQETEEDEQGNERPVRQTGWHIKKWELLEFSAVPIPANPMALVQKESFDVVENQIVSVIDEFEGERFEDYASAWVKSFDIEDTVEEPTQDEEPSITLDDSKELHEIVNKLVERITELEVKVEEIAASSSPTAQVADSFTEEAVGDDDNNSKSVVPFRATPKADESRSWDKTAAIARLRRWASSDGSGSKDKINWNKYRQAFAWYDSNDAQNFGAYKLPHHDVENGQLVVVWSGVRAAMAALMGARGGVNIPDSDRRGVYSHLAKHYRQFDKEPPEFKDLELLDNPEEFVVDLVLNNKEVQEQIIERVMQIIEGKDEQ